MLEDFDHICALAMLLLSCFLFPVEGLHATSAACAVGSVGGKKTACSVSVGLLGGLMGSART